MPQMNPMYWEMLSITTMIMLIMMMTKMYFHTSINLFKNNKEKKLMKMMW